jgi:hypothetical protein
LPSAFSSDTPIVWNRVPRGMPKASSANWLLSLSIGPLWHAAQAPCLTSVTSTTSSEWQVLQVRPFPPNVSFNAEGKMQHAEARSQIARGQVAPRRPPPPRGRAAAHLRAFQECDQDCAAAERVSYRMEAPDAQEWTVVFDRMSGPRRGGRRTADRRAGGVDRCMARLAAV